MGSDRRENTVLPQTEQHAVRFPEQVGLVARFASENIRYFYIIILLSIISLVSIAFAWKESNRAESNIKVAWVKMYPNGTWDVEFNDDERGPDFFQTTIDYILTQWVERRYSELSVSVESDYGYAHIFMSDNLRNAFVDPNGFDAVGRAAKIATCVDCEGVKVKVRNLDHYDSDLTKFGSHEGTLYRTNVFATRTLIGKDGVAGASEKIIVPLQWRIKSKEEIQAQRDLLKQNPIGLEIVAYDLLKDVS